MTTHRTCERQSKRLAGLAISFAISNTRIYDGRKLMKYTRIYADAHGESHFEDVEVGMKQAPYNAGTISEMIAAKGVMFRLSGEYFIDWHNAPRRQFVVNLTGTVEIVASDGEKRRLGPGSILLAEDLIGKAPSKVTVVTLVSPFAVDRSQS